MHFGTPPGRPPEGQNLRKLLLEPIGFRKTPEMNLILYPKLGTVSRQVLLRRTRQPNAYTPRRHLLARLSRETGMTLGQVWEQLEREREYLLASNDCTEGG
jgi:hypothetical protein